MYLFVDTEFRGHHSEYLDILIRHTIEMKMESNFIVSDEYLKSRPKLGNTDTHKFTKICSTGNFISEFSSILNIVRQQSFHRCYLLNFNRYFKIIPFWLKPTIPIFSIYFLPFLAKKNISTSELVTKCFYMKLITQNPNVKKIFVLNDAAIASELNQKLDTDKFHPLADPVFIYGNGFMINRRNSETAQKNSKTSFLFLGEVSERKGIYKLLSAIRHIPPDVRKRITINIAGNASNDANNIRQAIEKLSTFHPNLFKFVSLSRINENTFEKLLFSADYILLLHQRSEGSSGILGKASVARKPVIGPREGLIGKLIREYNLGIQIDTKDPRAIASALIQCSASYSEAVKHNFSGFMIDHSPEKFVSTLLE